MPEISRFFGMIITMYYNDHVPPHFHVRYGSKKARFDIDALEFLDGDIGHRAERLIKEWAVRHQGELQDDWALAQSRQTLNWIEPLE